MQRPATNDDLYALLGISPEAPLDEITLAYRKCARTWHPDRNAAAGAADTFRRIRHAYEVLRDPTRRAAYDRALPARTRRRRQSGPGTAATAARAPAASREPAAENAPDLRRRVRITLQQQLAGCRHTLKLTRTEYCVACRGSGASGAAPTTCASCRGAGEVREAAGFFPFFRYEAKPCAACSGAGTLRTPCATCDGSGVDAKKIGLLRFAIPAGIRPESSLRVRGHGRRSRAGAACGDLVIRVGIAPHPSFTPAFPDLRCTMPVSVFRVLAGGSIVVPTLETPVSVPLPADAADGSVLRVAGHGMLDAATGQRGDLLATLRVIRPRALSAAQRDLLAQLDRLTMDEPR